MKKKTKKKANGQDYTDHIVKLLAEKGLTLNQLFQKMGAKKRPTKAELQEIMDGLSAEKRIFTWNPRGKVIYYCAFEPSEAVQQAVLAALKKGDQTPAQLAIQARKRLPQFAASHLEPFIEPQLEDSLVYFHPPKTGNKKEKPYYSLERLEPRDYLKGVLREFELASKRLEPVGFTPRQVLLSLARELGLDLKVGPQIEKAPPVPENLKDQLLNRITPQARNGEPVFVRDLRRQVPAPKADFDQALIDLAREDRIELYFDDFPDDLTPAERDELVADDAGNYYSVIVLKEEI